MAKGELTIVLDQKDYQKMERLLSGMENVEKTQVINNALKKGAEVIMEKGKQNLQTRNKKKTGNLLRSFTTSVKKKSGYAGFRRSNKQGVRGGNHSYLVSEGTKIRYTRSGAYRGSVSKGRPNTGSRFWSDAVETEGPRALEKVMDAIYEALNNIK